MTGLTQNPSELQLDGDWSHFFLNIPATLQAFPLILSVLRSIAQPNVTAVTLQVEGYTSVSWACDYGG